MGERLGGRCVAIKGRPSPWSGTLVRSDIGQRDLNHVVLCRHVRGGAHSFEFLQKISKG